MAIPTETQVRPAREDRHEARHRRPIDHRVAVRVPAVAHLATSAVLRMPQGSCPRLALLLRTARLGYEAWQRDDLAIARAHADPEIEVRLEQAPGVPLDLADVYHGPDGYCRVMEEWAQAWRSWHFELADVIEVDRNQILVTGRHFGVGRASGVEVEQWGGALYTFRRGKIVRVHGFFGSDVDEILRNAGDEDRSAH